LCFTAALFDSHTHKLPDGRTAPWIGQSHVTAVHALTLAAVLLKVSGVGERFALGGLQVAIKCHLF